MTIWAVLIVLFNVITFFIGGIENGNYDDATFWIGYVFIMLTFLGQLGVAWSVCSTDSLQKLFYNLPLIKVSYSGLIAAVIVGSLCMALSGAAYWIGVIVCCIVLAIIVIAGMKAKIAADAVSAIDEKVKVKTFFIKALTVDAEGLMARAQTEEIKAECKAVYEAVRYSDPMSHEALAATETQITLSFAELTNAVCTNDVAGVKAKAQVVRILVDDRNKKCKLLK